MANGKLTPEEEAELARLEAEEARGELGAPVEEPLPAETAEWTPPALPSSGDALDAIMRGLETISSYTDAPSRAALSSAIRQGAGTAPGAFAAQAGLPPQTAPSGEDIAAQLGLSRTPFGREEMLAQAFDLTPGGRGVGEEPLPMERSIAKFFARQSPASIAGLPIELGADITNLLPLVGPVARGVRYGARAARLPEAARAIGRGTARTASALTGMPEQDIITYATKRPQVREMLAQSGDNIAEAADIVRRQSKADVRTRISALNQDIAAATESGRGKVTKQSPSIEPIMDRLRERLGRLNMLKDDDVAAARQIRDTMRQVEQLSVRGPEYGMPKALAGKTNPASLHDIKQVLQGLAEPVYDRISGTQIFTGGPKAASAARDAAATARRMANQHLGEKYRAANLRLEALHREEKRMNKNLLTERAPESALIAAGRGTNERNRNVLARLGQMTGTPIQERSELLSAAQSFANPPLLPTDVTGKGVARQNLAGGLIGGALGTLTTGSPYVGLGVATLTSPAMLKALIDAGHISRDTIRAIVGAKGPFNEAMIPAAARILGSPSGPALLEILQQTGTASATARQKAMEEPPR